MNDEENKMKEKIVYSSMEDEVIVVSHNKTDYEAFRNHQKKIDARFENFEKEQNKRNRLKNLFIWDEKTLPRWKGASLSKLRYKDLANKILDTIKKNNDLVSFFVTGEPDSGKTYIAYSIFRRYIGLGWLQPSEVKIITEDDLISIASIGWEGNSKFNDFLNPKYKAYFFEDVGIKNNYSEKMQYFWESLINHVYKNSLVTIFTSSGTVTNFMDILNQTSESKFKKIINNNNIQLKSVSNSETQRSYITEAEKLNAFDS